MAIWYNWAVIAPLPRFTDDGSRDLCNTRISISDVGEFEVAIVGTKKQVELIRVGVLNTDGNTSPVQKEAIPTLIDQALTVLRITYDATIDRVWWRGQTLALGMFDRNGKPHLNVSIEELLGHRTDVPVQNVADILATGLEHRPLLKLISDAQMPTQPLQYRYLSLYKILELEFRTFGQWNGLNELLEPHEDVYQALKISEMALSNLVHHMRDKCAHIKVGRNDSPGIAGLDGPDAAIARALLEFLMPIVMLHLNSKSLGFAFAQTSGGSALRLSNLG